LFYEPVMRDIETFFTSSQQHVTGTVHVRLHPYHFETIGIESPYDLMQSKFGSYGEMNNTWSGEDVRGFAKIFSNQIMIYEQVKKENEKG
jgi:argininosuccinate synthase